MKKTVKTAQELAAMIDHTILKADATSSQIMKVCQEAKEYKFKTVCVNSSRIEFCVKALEGSEVLPIAVVGFPLGAMTTESKAWEAKHAVSVGAKEIDMVINVGWLKDKNYDMVAKDIVEVVKASTPMPVKVIIETSLLTDDEKVKVCELSKDAGAAFVKTSTGFSTAGATVSDIALMRKTVGSEMGVKASGGIRSWDIAKQMIEAGASRLGASASIQILQEAEASSYK